MKNNLARQHSAGVQPSLASREMAWHGEWYVGVAGSWQLTQVCPPSSRNANKHGGMPV